MGTPRVGHPQFIVPGLGTRSRMKGMILALLAMRLLEAMFFLGLAGSAVVVLIAFFEDAKELFGED